MLNCISILQTCSARNWYSDISHPPAPPERSATQPSLLIGTPSRIFSVAISTRINSAGFLHERLKPRPRHPETTNVPQSPCPLADCLAIDIAATGAANDGSKWVRVPVEGRPSEFKRAPQKLLGFSSHFVVVDDFEHGFQIPIHRVTSSTGLELVPRVSDLIESSPNTSFWGFVSVRAACSTQGHGSQHRADPEKPR